MKNIDFFKQTINKTKGSEKKQESHISQVSTMEKQQSRSCVLLQNQLISKEEAPETAMF